jgi:hypothetical protein
MSCHFMFTLGKSPTPHAMNQLSVSEFPGAVYMTVAILASTAEEGNVTL